MKKNHSSKFSDNPSVLVNSTWIKANAGSGKTRNLIIRLTRLLLKEVPLEKILCLTYTNIAAAEMQNRILEELGGWIVKKDHELEKNLLDIGVLLPQSSEAKKKFLDFSRQLFGKVLESPDGVKIQTIHGFCGNILRNFPSEANVPVGFKIIDEKQKRQLIKSSLINFSRSEKIIFQKGASFLNELEEIDFFECIIRLQTIFYKDFELVNFCDVFGLRETTQESEAEWNRIFFGLPKNTLDICIGALKKSSKATNEKRLKQLLVAKESSAEIGLQCLEKIFLRSSDGKPYKKILTSDLESRIDSETKSIFYILRERINSYRQSLNQSLFAKNTLELYDFAKGFLKFYNREKKLLELLDYDDLLAKTLELFKDADSKWVLFKLDEGVDHVLVDEAQDTSPLQWAILVELLDDFFADNRAVSGQRSIFVVGDPKQSIYSFQGADPIQFDMKKQFFARKLSDLGANLNEINLAMSFRSSKAIIDLINQLIDDGIDLGVEAISSHKAFFHSMPGRVELWPNVKQKNPNKRLSWWESHNQFTEESPEEILAELIAKEIKRILASKINLVEVDQNFQILKRVVGPGDFLILLQNRKSKNLFNLILKKLSDYALPVVGSDQINLLEELAVCDLLSLLKFLNNPLDDLSLAEALRSPILGVTEEELFQICYDRKGSLYESLSNNLPNHLATRILDDLVLHGKSALPYELIQKILVNHDGRTRLIARLGVGVDSALDSLLSEAINYEFIESPSLAGFLRWVTSFRGTILRKRSKSRNKIRVMTVHGAKGIESPIVILPQAFLSPRQRSTVNINVSHDWALSFRNDKELPDKIKEIKEEQKMQIVNEDNRLLYVALSRAKNWLIICGSGPSEVRTREHLNWYMKCKKALEKLGAKKQKCPKGMIGKSLVLDHNWQNKN